MADAVFIMNPSSGREKAVELKLAIEEGFSKHFDRIDIKITESAEDAVSCARKACEERVDSVFAVGGDGTVNLVISGIAESEYRPKFGIIPMGTVNNLARVLGIPMNWKRVIDRFNPELTTHIDIGKVNDKYFGYAFSVGTIPEVIHNVSSEDKTRLGSLAYFKEIAKSIPNMKLYPLIIDMDGEEIRTEVSNLVVVTTNRLYNIKYSDAVELGDGKLSLLLFKDLDFFNGIEMSGNAILGEIEESEVVDQYDVERISIRVDSDKDIADESVEIDIDGNCGGTLPAEVKVLKRHLKAYYYEKGLAKGLGLDKILNN